MKKIISLALAVLMIFSCLVTGVSAMSINVGVNELQTQFKSGDGILDYVYYSPVKNDKDKTKYPLVIWIHGNSSGDYPGHQLDNCDIALWSSEEYQSRFEGTKGAFLFLPRYPTSSVTLAWELPAATLKTSIDNFIADHKDSIDTNRIYIGGYSLGGKMVLRMASTYPEFFAAAFPLSPVYVPTVAELNCLVDMPIWFAWCTKDTYVSLNSVTVNSNWDYLMSISNRKEDCRLVTFNDIYYFDYRLRNNGDAGDTHNTWDAACRDFFMIDGAHYKDVTITDGNGKEITLVHPKGFIYWLSSQTLSEESTGNSGIISRILSKMFDFFKNFFISLISILTDSL